MRKITELLRLKYAANLSHDKISRALLISKGAVAKYVARFEAAGLSWPLPEGTDEAALERLLGRQSAPQVRFVEPDFFVIHQALKRKGVTLQLLWEEYVEAHGGHAWRSTQFCHHYRQWRAGQRRSMRQQHTAGERLFIDYCGPTVAIADRDSGAVINAQIFVAVFGASSYTYAEATRSQALPDWIGSHQRALRFFGGVPQLLVPDNLRSAVSKPCRYEPEVNLTYAEMARHYGTVVMPARPYKPKDKAKAEVAVQVVERWILARLRHRQFFSLSELNDAIAELLVDLNARPFQRRTESRRDLFEQLDKPALQPLPSDSYSFARWLHVTPGIDYHVCVEQRYYSVPHALVGKRLAVRLGESTVEVFSKGNRVAMHLRHGREDHSTQAEHMPASHKAHRQWSPSRMRAWALDTGPGCLAVVDALLAKQRHAESGYRACLGLIRLSRAYPPLRLERACLRAVEIGSPSYTSVQSILKKGLDQLDEATPPLDTATPAEPSDAPTAIHSNVRGAHYYH